MTTYFRADYDTWMSREPNNDGWDNGDVDGNFSGIEETQYDGYDSVATELTGPVSVVYVTYYTGSTFGRDYRAKALGVFQTPEEALEFIQVARSNEGGYSFEYNGETYYRDWVGYFESLIDIDYESRFI